MSSRSSSNRRYSIVAVLFASLIVLALAACTSNSSDADLVTEDSRDIANIVDSVDSSANEIVQPRDTPIVTSSGAAEEPVASSDASASTGVDGTAVEYLSTAVEQAFDTYAEADAFSGVIFLARNGEIILSKGYGFADHQAQVPIDAQTRFRIGSVTKQFTAMIILMLHEQGLLHITDPICYYVTDCPAAWSAITVEHLLTHTSGIPDFTFFPNYEPSKAAPTTLPETIARFRNRPLEFAPGTAWNYTNSGYILLGQIIETVTGQTYDAVVQTYLFDPLGMVDSGYDYNRDDLAVGYADASGVEADFIHMTIPHAAGALYSTANDLLKWDRALASGELISPELQKAMFSVHAIIPDSGGLGYGYGWIVSELFGRQIVFHGGGIEGFSANITRVPEDGTVIVMLSNIEQTNPQAATLVVMQELYGED